MTKSATCQKTSQASPNGWRWILLALLTRKIFVHTKAMELRCVWGRQRHVEEGYLELKMDTHRAMRHTSRELSSKVPSWQQAGRAMGKSLRA